MTPRVYVDFNEMQSANEVLLSQTDTKADSEGGVVEFIEGEHVAVYMDDQDEYGEPDNLISDGIAAKNTAEDWSSTARWILRIDRRGIRHQSDEPAA